MDPADLLLVGSAFIMPALYAVSVVTLGVVLERCWSLLRNRVSAEEAHRFIEAARAVGTAQAADGAKGGSGALERVLSSWRGADGHRGGVEQSVVCEQALLERNVWLLDCAASIAPLLGILGTLVGISQSFGGFDRISTLDPVVVSRGISLALHSTAVGLVVAIAALVCAHLFRRLADSRGQALEDFAEALLGIRER